MLKQTVSILLVLIFQISSNYQDNRQKLVDKINADSSIKWKAYNYEQFKDITDKEFATKYLGAILEPIKSKKVEEILTDIPESFDAREKWSTCIGAIRNQLHCGSCWAFSGTSTFADRLCINQGKNVVLSPQQLVSCDTYYAHGCKGATITSAWEYFNTHGVVENSCYPYTSGEGVNGVCQDKNCNLQKSTAPTSIGTESSWKHAIMTNGPIQAAYIVFNDFMNYKSGVYHKSAGAIQVGGHAIEVVGWGVEAGDKYWLVKNSWGASWGLDGYFKIGINECGFPDMGAFGCPEEGCTSTPTPPSKPSDKTKSCVGHCKSVILNIFGSTLCSCLDVCPQLGDCCNDAESVCNIKPPTPPPVEKASCVGHCGKNVFYNGKLCMCMDYCKKLNNCCPDYEAVCPKKLRTENI